MMGKEKAYKLLAVQEGLSNGAAKKLIDDGYVFVGTRKVNVARAELDADTRFKVLKPEALEVLLDEGGLLAVNKPWGVESYDLEKRLGATLIHRLDKGTSGVLLLARNEEVRLQAVEEFRLQKVYKEYIAVVSGVVAEEAEIDLPVLTERGKRGAKSRIDPKGKPAKTRIEPMELIGKKSLVRCIITTGRTHQIRVHLSHLGHPIVGDTLYGGKSARRMMLHALQVKLLGREITAPLPQDFRNADFLKDA